MSRLGAYGAPSAIAVVLAIAAFAASLPACSSKSETPSCKPGGDGTYTTALYDDLASYCMVSLKNGAVVPESGVTSYELNTPLFSDYAMKYRTVWMPPGKSAPYAADGVFEFPVGTIITKSFGFPKDFRDPSSPVKWIETRIFARGDAGWLAVSYEWDDAQSKATKKPGGTVIPLTFIDAEGTTRNASYLVPNTNQCPKCHDSSMVLQPIGPRAAQLNRDHTFADGAANQLAKWTALGIVSGAPSPDAAPKLAVWDDPSSGSTSDRARAYLDGNCSYCHNPKGEARTTGLFLTFPETDATRLGVCKAPVAAGRASSNLTYDVVPGQPDQSILVYRMQATEPSVAMPEIGRSLVHTEAVALVRDWITSLPGACATP